MASRRTGEGDGPAAWDQLSAVIDKAVSKLHGVDRQVIILRYFHDKAHSIVAADLGISVDAAAKRTQRALAKLRGILAHMGLETAEPTLTALLSAHTLLPAPAQLPAIIASSIASSVSIPSITLSIAKGATRMMFWTPFRAVAAIFAFSIILAAGITATVVATTDEPRTHTAVNPAEPRPSQPAATQPAATQPANRVMSDDMVLRGLERVTPRAQFHAGLADAIEFMRDITGLKLDVQWDKLKAIGITEKTPVTVNLRNAKMYVVLTAILNSATAKPGTIGWVVENGAVVIGPSNSLTAK